MADVGILWQIAHGLAQDSADEMERPCSNMAACLFIFLGCVVLPVLPGDLFAAFSVRADCLDGVWRWAFVHGRFGCSELERLGVLDDLSMKF